MISERFVTEIRGELTFIGAAWFILCKILLFYYYYTHTAVRGVLYAYIMLIIHKWPAENRIIHEIGSPRCLLQLRRYSFYYTH